MTYILLFLLFIILLIVAIVGISYYVFRMTFQAPKHLEANRYFVPQGPQYEEKMEDIKDWVSIMAARPYEKVFITSFDGTKLFARYYHFADGAPLQIQFHGYKSSSILDFSGGSILAHRLGHNALVVDQRSHGQSEGNIITFGVKERRDCYCWIQYALKRFGANVPILLSGLSMGAATVLMALDLGLPENVKGIIADCPFSSPKEIILKVGKDRGFPSYFMYPFVYLAALLFGHFRLTETNALSAIHNTSIPVLLLHGEDDRFVPFEMSKKLKESGGENVTLETFPDAGHGLCYLTNPKKYEFVTEQFVKKIMR